MTREIGIFNTIYFQMVFNAHRIISRSTTSRTECTFHSGEVVERKFKCTQNMESDIRTCFLSGWQWWTKHTHTQRTTNVYRPLRLYTHTKNESKKKRINCKCEKGANDNCLFLCYCCCCSICLPSFRLDCYERVCSGCIRISNLFDTHFGLFTICVFHSIHMIWWCSKTPNNNKKSRMKNLDERADRVMWQNKNAFFGFRFSFSHSFSSRKRLKYACDSVRAIEMFIHESMSIPLATKKKNVPVSASTHMHTHADLYYI